MHVSTSFVMQMLLRNCSQALFGPCRQMVPHVHGQCVWFRVMCRASLKRVCLCLGGLLHACTCLQIPPKTVDGIFSADQGVWHPDELQPTTEWTGSKSAADKIPGLPHSAFNPFATLPPKERVDTFTERLAAAADDASLAALQWAMPQYGTLAETDTNRSNLPIANQHMQPSWLSKPGWLAFGGLRSYPLGQLRRLCEALRGRLLPWSQPAVAALVRQTLFHVGEMVGDGEGMRLLWRTGWDQPDDVLKVGTLPTHTRA